MRRTIWLAALAACFALPGSAGAILGGQPDGSNHPSVGLLTNRNTTCSGALISPTVMLTAAHCSFALGTNSLTGAPLVAASFAADPRNEGGWHIGTFYADPAADVAIVSTSTSCSRRSLIVSTTSSFVSPRPTMIPDFVSTSKSAISFARRSSQSALS